MYSVRAFLFALNYNITDYYLHNWMLILDNFIYSLEKGNRFKTFSFRSVIYVVVKVTYLEKVLKVC